MNNYSQAQIPPGMLLRVIQDKQMKIAYYEQLYKMTEDNQYIEFINGILFDEKNHLHMFTNLYNVFFGEKPPVSEPEISQMASFIHGVKNSIKLELDSHQFYSNVLFSDTNLSVREVFAQALADENRHNAKCNFIYTQLLEEIKETRIGSYE